MSTETRRTARTAHDERRKVYRLTGDQVFKMIEHGILPETTRIELWDGVLYEMTKGELHNAIVGEIADQLRSLHLPGYHVREEKSNRDGEWSLPAPDLAVCHGKRFDDASRLPPLDKLALVVEVNHNTSRADTVVKLRRYAEVGIPVYWVVDVLKRTLNTYTRPGGPSKDPTYAMVETFGIGQSMPIVIDGREVGRLDVANLFPPETIS